MLLLTAGLGVMPVLAQTGASLTIKPKLCIVDSRQPSCEMKLKVSWSTPQTGDYCLHDNRSNDPLECWQGASSGTYRGTRSVDAILLLRLVDENGDVVARTEVQVLDADSADRRRKRTRRRVWSIL